MLDICFASLSLAVVLGACLVAGRLLRASIAHGVAGGVGLLLFLLVMRAGTLKGPFATDTAVLLAGAFAGGLTLWVLARRRQGRPSLIVFLHATAGGLAYLLLAGFVFSH